MLEVLLLLLLGFLPPPLELPPEDDGLLGVSVLVGGVLPPLFSSTILTNLLLTLELWIIAWVSPITTLPSFILTVVSPTFLALKVKVNKSSFPEIYSPPSPSYKKLFFFVL